MPAADIVRMLADRGYVIEPEALRLLLHRADLLDRLLARMDPLALVVTVGDVQALLAPEGAAARPGADDAAAAARAIGRAPGRAPPISGAPAGRATPGRPRPAPGKAARAPEVDVLRDITDNSTCIGDYDEFVGFFRNRYSVLGEMIRPRLSARPIESLRRNGVRRSANGEKNEVSLIGMVGGVRPTSGGHRIADLEDPTGSIGVLFSRDKDLADAPLLPDEVIGVTGQPTNDGGLFIPTAITYPDVPHTNVPRRSAGPAVVALLSDIHIGSDTFMEDGWLRFIDWANGDLPDDGGTPGADSLVDRLRYVVVAGDVVDGIGIYPGQEKELVITDVYEQYEQAARYLRMLPRHLRIVVAPGNHDAVRQAEPQPALPPGVRAMFKQDNITFVGNPSLVEIEGVRILIYHGRSLDDLVSSLPGVSYARPDAAMVELLKRRHLSPIYGGRVMIAPEARDHFIIDPLPDIIHSGHVHTVGVSRYRGVLLANSGTWQGQTEFQRRMNIQPDPCKIPLVDLHSGEVKIKKFGV